MPHRAIKVTELLDDAALIVEVDGIEVGIFRRGDRVVAYRNLCPHQGGPVCTGMVIGKVEAVLGPDRRVLTEWFSPDQIHVVCPWHGWEFNLDSGRCAADPRKGLQPVSVEIQGDDLYVRL